MVKRKKQSWTRWKRTVVRRATARVTLLFTWTSCADCASPRKKKWCRFTTTKLFLYRYVLWRASISRYVTDAFILPRRYSLCSWLCPLSFILTPKSRLFVRRESIAENFLSRWWALSLFLSLALTKNRNLVYRVLILSLNPSVRCTFFPAPFPSPCFPTFFYNPLHIFPSRKYLFFQYKRSG